MYSPSRFWNTCILSDDESRALNGACENLLRRVREVVNTADVLRSRGMVCRTESMYAIACAIFYSLCWCYYYCHASPNVNPSRIKVTSYGTIQNLWGIDGINLYAGISLKDAVLCQISCDPTCSHVWHVHGLFRQCPPSLTSGTNPKCLTNSTLSEQY